MSLFFKETYAFQIHTLIFPNHFSQKEKQLFFQNIHLLWFPVKQLSNDVQRMQKMLSLRKLCVRNNQSVETIFFTVKSVNFNCLISENNIFHC